MEENTNHKMSAERTVSLCVPAAVVCRHNRNLDQLTHAAYEIARSACMFKVSEVIVLGEGKEDRNSLVLGSLLQFFITPRYLVQETFAKAFASGQLPRNVFNKAKTLPLVPTLLEYLQPGVNKACKYREGISINKNVLKHRRKNASGKVCKVPKAHKTTRFVQVGAGEVLELAGETDGLPLNVRVTVDMAEKKVVGVQEAWGPYTGYVVRLAASVEDVFTEVNTALVGEDGYDMSLVARTSDFFARTKTKTPVLATLPEVSREEAGHKSHVLVVVTGPAGEGGAEDEAGELFDGAIRVPEGSRVEEGVVIALSVACRW